MAKSKTKPNPYEGTATFYVDGRPISELNPQYVSALITDGFIRGMFSVQNRGLMDFGFAGWEYKGLDYEKIKKDEV